MSKTTELNQIVVTDLKNISSVKTRMHIINVVMSYVTRHRSANVDINNFKLNN